MKQSFLKEAWERFGDTPINENDDIDEEFQVGDVLFEKGTDRIEIWHWFDEQFKDGLYKEMFE